MVGVDSRLISGREKLDSIVKIERSTKTYIDVDKVYRQANIYGNDANKKKARTKLAKLMADVQSATDMPTDMSVPLESKNNLLVARFPLSFLKTSFPLNGTLWKKKVHLSVLFSL